MPAPNNSASIVGARDGLEMALRHMEDDKTLVKAMRDRLEQGIRSRCRTASSPATGATVCPIPHIASEYIEG